MPSPVPPSARRRVRRDESGAVLVLVALAMSALFTATALAVDLGRVAATKRQEQALVDIVAIDAARALVSGVPTSLQYPVVLTAAQQSAGRNGFLLEDIDDLDVILGTWDDATRSFAAHDPDDPATGALIPDAVRVVAGDRVKFLFDAGSADPTRQAIAVHRLAGVCVGPACFPDETTTTTTGPVPTTGPGPTTTTTPPPTCVPASLCVGTATAGITIGSFLVGGQPSVGTLNALVSSYLDAPAVSGTLVGYQGLADATVTLDDLRTALRLGSIDELLTTDLALGDVLAAFASVLAADGTSSGAAASALVGPWATLARDADTSFGPLNLGDLVEVSSGAGSAAAVTALPALPIVFGTLQLANRDRLLDVDLGAVAPGFDRATLQLLVIEPPVTAIGPAAPGSTSPWVTTARTAQARAQLELSTLVAGVGRVTIPVVLEGAGATGSLTRVACPVAGDNGSTLELDTEALRASIGRVADLTDASGGVLPAPIAQVLGATVLGSSSVTIPGAYADPDFAWDRTLTDGPPQTYRLGATLPDVSLGDSLLGSLTLSSTVGSVPPLLPAALQPVVGRAGDVLDELVGSLGLQVGGADVFALRPTCTAPVLVTP